MPSTPLPAEILAQASVAVVATDLLGRVTYLNLGAERLYGATLVEAFGRHVKDVVSLPGDHESVDQIVAAVNAQGEWVGSTWARNADGARISLLLTVTPLRSRGRVVGMVGVAIDNTDRHKAESEHARLAAAVDQTAESVMIADAQANIVYVNPAFERISGYTLPEVVGKNPRILQSGDQSPTYYRLMWKTLSAGRTWSGELVNRRKDGSLYREQATITPVFDSAGELSTYVAVKRDITRLREIEETLAESTRNRLAVIQALAHLTAAGSVAENAHEIASALLTLPGVDRSGVIAFEDADVTTLIGFRGPPSHPVQEGEGMPLPRAAYLRERALLGPWVESTDVSVADGEYGARLAASGLLAVVYAPFGHGQALGLIAVGTDQVAVASRMANYLPIAVEFAATATYLLGEGLRARRSLAAERGQIESILEAQAFKPVFQPIVDMEQGLTIGFEALTRFDVPTPPDQVFESAAILGLGLDLEVATLRASIRAAEGLPDGNWLSLNVSPSLVLESDRLRDLLAAQSRPIVLEITEHIRIADYEALRSAYLSLGGGIRLAVDDAGAGVANFEHIIELRPDFLKIDIGFIRGVDMDLTRQALIAGLRHFALATNCLLIAEGVETEAERTTLRTLGVHLGQGFLLGRPAEAAQWR